MNCNHCGVLIKNAEDVCWSCGKIIDLSSQTPAAESQSVFSVPNPPSLQSPVRDMGLSPTFATGQASSMLMPRSRESEAAIIDPVRFRKLQKKVRNAVIVAVLAGLLTFVASVTGLIETYAIADTFLILALGYGIYKQSFMSAVVLIVYFAASKAYLFLTVPGTLSGGSVAASGLVLVYLIDGAIAIKTLHRQRKSL